MAFEAILPPFVVFRLPEGADLGGSFGVEPTFAAVVGDYGAAGRELQSRRKIC
jgi:hypothetical protein